MVVACCPDAIDHGYVHAHPRGVMHLSSDGVRVCVCVCVRVCIFYSQQNMYQRAGCITHAAIVISQSAICFYHALRRSAVCSFSGDRNEIDRTALIGSCVLVSKELAKVNVSLANF